MLFNRRKLEIPTADQALKGRTEQWFTVADKHRVLDAPVVTDEVPEGLEVAVFGLGCFWGAEEVFWRIPGVWSTSVGYAGGTTPHPSYDEVCSGQTGHTEAVRVVFDPTQVAYADLVKAFFEFHDPTQGMRQTTDSAMRLPINRIIKTGKFDWGSFSAFEDGSIEVEIAGVKQWFQNFSELERGLRSRGLG